MPAPFTPDSSLLALMQVLSTQPDTSQRELSKRLGWSLGRTHYLVRALVEKGWVKAQNFRQSSNKRAYMYLLTPRGVVEKLKLTQSFLQHKERQFHALQIEIAALKAELRNPPVEASSEREAAPGRSSRVPEPQTTGSVT